MKKLLTTFALVFATLTVASAQILVKNTSNTDKGALASVSSHIVIDQTSANWFTVMLNQQALFENVSASAEIAAISISVKRTSTEGAMVYDDVVRLFVPASMNFDGSEKTSNEKDIVSANLSSSKPWANGTEIAIYGDSFQNWGLEGITVAEILKYGLGFEYKADGDLEKSGVQEIEATIYFNGTSQNAVKLTGSINQGRFR